MEPVQSVHSVQPGPPGSLSWLADTAEGRALSEALLADAKAAVRLEGLAEAEGEGNDSRLCLRWGSVAGPEPPEESSSWPKEICRLCGAAPVAVASAHPEMTVGRCAACGCGQVLAFGSEEEGSGAGDDYSRRYKAELRAGKAAACWRLFEEHVLNRPGATSGEVRKVLDVGCGEGEFLDLARQAGLQTAGLEVSPKAAVAALAKGHELYCQSVEVEVFPPGHLFDVVVLWDVLEHLPRPGLALANALQALAPGGRLLILTPMMGSIFDRLGLLADRWTGGRVRQLVRMCWSRDHLSRFDRAGLCRVLDDLGYAESQAAAVSLLSLRPERYAGGEIMSSWSGLPAVDRVISRLGVTGVRLLRIHNKVFAQAVRPAQ